MTQSVQAIMTTSPLTADVTTSTSEVARMMRQQAVGDVIVMENGRICGILTDRDIVVRAVADSANPAEVPAGDICSRELSTLAPTDTIGDASRLMRAKAVRRLPVVDDGRPVGIVSIGDLAIEREPDSPLGDISRAAPNT